ncbi:MAG TPA: hypothetical protein VFB99_22315 [Vicinamibacterales bacterium]|nr:hypothetical protein [Vicinamibacterales bacterium]
MTDPINDAAYVGPQDMLAELREAHRVCDEHRDIASASLIDAWIDEAERRTWFFLDAGCG